MKKIKIYLFALLIVASTLGFSCKKNSLDKTPEVNISDVDFWKSSNDVRLYANGFYSDYLAVYTGFGTVGIYGLDADQGSDNMVKFDYNRFILNGERTLPASSEDYSWGDIRNVNYFLTNFKRVKTPFKEIQQYVAEGYFFRAFLYFDLLKSYGDLPWVNKPIAQDDQVALTAPRLSRSIIVDSLMNDLDKAISYLPSGKATELRITKPIAQALKARIALYEGTWEKYHAGTPFGVSGSNGKKFIEIAANTAQSIINDNVFSLDNVKTDMGYWKLFNQNDYSASSEIMFWRKYDPNQNTSNYWALYLRAGNGRGITKNLVEDYLCIDGKPISLSPLYKGDDSLKSIIDNRDPRLAQTICINDGKHFMTINNPNAPDIVFTVPAFTGANEDQCVTGYQTYKGLQTDQSKQLIDKGDGSVIYFRYPEVLLILAEAKAELGTITQTDIDITINKLRDRVGMPNLELNSIATDPKWIFPNLSPIINEVRRERRVEFAAEGYRHDDIWRWAAAKNLIVGWRPKGAKKAQWAGTVPATNLNLFLVDSQGYIDPYKAFTALNNGFKFNLSRDYLFPIPLDQFQLNKNMKQNPGW